jgi:alpha-methylacyl-CoA racemase
MNDAPLSGIRVLDLTRLLPGPYCSRILVDFGAQVIRVEPPEGGDWLRDAIGVDPGMQRLFENLNRGKKSMVINLRMSAGREVFLRLVRTADVLLEGFRPGVMGRLGLGYEVLHQANPRLIYASLTGYGQDGPYRDRVGHDLNYIGLTGLLHLTGEREGPPVIPATQVADIMGALWMAIGILIALQGRERTGEGCRVDGSLLGAALASLPLALASHQADQPTERGSGILHGGLVCYNIYETKDGRYMTLAALEPKFWRDFCEAAGREDLVGEQFAPAIPGNSAYEELRALFRSKTHLEWEDLLVGREVCCEPLFSLEEGLHCDPVNALGMVKELGLLPPIKMSVGGSDRLSPAPALGQSSGEILAELGYSLEEMRRLKEEGLI